jgi:hypothetical protein
MARLLDRRRRHLRCRVGLRLAGRCIARGVADHSNGAFVVDASPCDEQQTANRGTLYNIAHPHDRTFASLGFLSS